MAPIRYLATLIGAGDRDVLRWFILVVALLLETRRIYRPIPPLLRVVGPEACAAPLGPSRQGHTGPWPRLRQSTYIAAPARHALPPGRERSAI